MLDKIEAVSPRGTTLTLNLEDAFSGYSVQKVEGLDPVKATLITSSFGELDGSDFQSSRREDRNIVLTLGIEPDYMTSQSVRGLRKALYAYFMPEAEVTLRFFLDDEPPVAIVGRVESFEDDMFSAETAVVISIMCFNPDFFNPVPEVVSGMTTALEDEFTIDYDGTVDTGLMFYLSPDRNISEFTIYQRTLDGSIYQLEFASSVAPLVAGDVLSISTIPGSKSVMKNTTESVLYAISPQSSWLKLLPGPNYFRVYAEGLPIPFEIRYTNKYGGL